MINILVENSNGNIIAIQASGHANYAQSGYDIVCSAVSTLMQSLAVGLQDVIGIKAEIDINSKIPNMSVRLKNVQDPEFVKAQVLMQTTYLSLKNIADSYKKFINIKEK